MDAVLKYAQQRMKNHTVANGKSLETLEPRLVAYIRMSTLLASHRCNVTVHGNLRGYSADFLITDTARYLGIPSVSELLNLFTDKATTSDVIVGPSLYSLEHSSVRNLRSFEKAEEGNDDLEDQSLLYETRSCIGRFTFTCQFHQCTQ